MSRYILASVAAVVACAALHTATPAHAQPAPANCSSADLTGVMTGVMAATSAYLYTHPPVNDFFSTLKGKSPEERRAALEAFMSANPQVQAELRGIRQPMKDFRNRCG
ncbi:hemophore-related protein [Mycolicibacterium iranicum]|uniref:Hemophore-related protein n=1 Tax=Mycolicibacterium iranicum TaxID=912594 RepID=A0A839QB34_MYCIR|nr:heme-binding protein [Mycolicibacterium iranicum]MBB2991416.1 hemophore-related protein [Mycolicibacterium iranicum]